MKLIYHPLANQDVIEAATYYARESPNLATAFLDEVDAAAKRVRRNPLAFEVVGHEIRRCLLHRFPYGFYFRIVPEYIRVLAVKHHSRNPDYGMERR